jgi:threonine dehydratase
MSDPTAGALQGLLSRDAIANAQELLRREFTPTRLVRAQSLCRITGRNVHLKLESDLPTGSFKVRGALYALTIAMRRRTMPEVVASSTGNHGAAVAYAARKLSLPARIFVPANANPVKRQRIESFGAQLIKGGRDLSEAHAAAYAYCEREGAFFLNDATDPDLPAGPATIACEIFDQLPGVDTVVVPVGDTALIRGMASAIVHASRSVKVIGVQAECAPSYYLSWKEGHVVSTETCDTIADGLATRTPVAANVAAIRELVAEMRLVGEAEMLNAIRHLIVEEHIVSEPAGAATTAALLQSAAGCGESIVAVMTGANVSPEILRRALK